MNNPAKSNIPHYIHGTQSSHAKRLKQPNSTAHVDPGKNKTQRKIPHGIAGHKTSGSDNCMKENQQDEIERLSSLVKEQQEKLLTLQLSAEKENYMKEEVDDITSKLQKTEEKLEVYEKCLMLHDIDPVTLESLQTSEEQKVLLTEIRDKTQTQVAKVVSNIKEINIKTAKLIDDFNVLGEEIVRICQPCQAEM